MEPIFEQFSELIKDISAVIKEIEEILNDLRPADTDLRLDRPNVPEPAVLGPSEKYRST